MVTELLHNWSTSHGWVGAFGRAFSEVVLVSLSVCLIRLGFLAISSSRGLARCDNGRAGTRLSILFYSIPI